MTKYLFLSLSLLIFLSACSTGWSNRHTTLTAYGMYAVHPVYGVIGLGWIDYEREPGDKVEANKNEEP